MVIHLQNLLRPVLTGEWIFYKKTAERYLNVSIWLFFCFNACYLVVFEGKPDALAESEESAGAEAR